ncbi:MAG: tetratricopeptide repeat protein [Sedimenticola sp.]|nr:tetratricopeptide repeat protein [Sedimenticola sp.]
MNCKRLIGVVLPALILTGCYTPPQRPAESITTRPTLPESSAIEQGAVTAPAREPEIQISAYEPASRPSLTPTHSKAVSALLKTASQQADQQDLDGAVSTVERALRIEPRNAYLWYRLANLRLDQGRVTLASDLAIKSLALAGGDVELKRKNWQLIAKAKRSSGDITGAKVAERKARMLN